MYIPECALIFRIIRGHFKILEKHKVHLMAMGSSSNIAGLLSFLSMQQDLMIPESSITNS